MGRSKETEQGLPAPAMWRGCLGLPVTCSQTPAPFLLKKPAAGTDPCRCHRVCPGDSLISGHQLSEPLPAPHLPLPCLGSGSTPAASPDLWPHKYTTPASSSVCDPRFCAVPLHTAGQTLITGFYLCACTYGKILQYGMAGQQPRPSRLPVGLNLALFLVTSLRHSARARSQPDAHDQSPLPYMLLGRPCTHSTHRGLHSSCGPGLAPSPVTDLHHQAHLKEPLDGHLHASSLMANTSLHSSAPMVRPCSHSNEC